MESTVVPDRTTSESLTDEEVARRVRGGETALYEIVMRRYNQRLYRVARAILHNDAEAEDVMQDTYVRAYEHLDQFAGRAPFSAWLTRIAVHEAPARLRLRNRTQSIDAPERDGELSVIMTSKSPDPEQNATGLQLREFLEEAVLSLPEHYRMVVMLRDIEELSTAETAQALELSEDNVKVRLHRGHGMVRSWLFDRIGSGAKEAFPFMGIRCNRVVEGVFDRLTQRSTSDSSPQ
jgi:RNA polymerase sigma-70 factor (ECF subfamily)